MARAGEVVRPARIAATGTYLEDVLAGLNVDEPPRQHLPDPVRRVENALGAKTAADVLS